MRGALSALGRACGATSRTCGELGLASGAGLADCAPCGRCFESGCCADAELATIARFDSSMLATTVETPILRLNDIFKPHAPLVTPRKTYPRAN